MGRVAGMEDEEAVAPAHILFRTENWKPLHSMLENTWKWRDYTMKVQ